MTHPSSPNFASAAPSAATRAQNLSFATPWLPAMLGILIICCESTRVMGADHTLVWLGHLSSPLADLAHNELVRLNTVLRKSGHFFGYGTLGVVLMQAWASLLRANQTRSWATLRRMVAGLGVGSVALVASLDELHQHFLPNRTGCVSDVLLDTSGAVLLISIASGLLWLHRHRNPSHARGLQTKLLLLDLSRNSSC